MKNLCLLTICTALLLTTMNACNDDSEGVIMPSAISNLTAEPQEGGVILRWDVPADSCLMYVRVNYQHPVSGKHITKNSSVWQDTLLIDGMLAKDGEYTFHVTPVSTSETAGETLSVSATALPVQPEVTVSTQKVLLTADNLYCNNPDPDEGKDIGYLVDGNYGNFFHTNWHNTGTEPHYIDFTLPEPVDLFQITSYYRGGSYGQCPEMITVLGSNDGETWNVIDEIEDNGEGGSSYTTPVLGTEGVTYSHIRYYADRTTGNAVYFALAEMEFYTVSYEIYDPEGIYNPGAEGDE